MSRDLETVLDVRALRRRWKPHKVRLRSEGHGESTSIRFHRACSWIARVEQKAVNDDSDLDLVSLWIAFNALYGQWDVENQEPLADRGCWRSFVDRILRLDDCGYVSDVFQNHKRLVMSLFQDEYLSSFFWRDPTTERAERVRAVRHKARSWYVEKRWTVILDEVLDRIYLMRCQLVHGAATHNSKLNRTSLRHCVTMLRHLLTAFLLVWIDAGSNEDWGPMCYPPT